MTGSEICDGCCCGCGACVSVCPRNAIAMKEDAHGFAQPVIDETACVDCHLCKRCCGAPVPRNRIQRALLLKIRDRTQHMLCQSGGAFTAASDAVLREGGVVFGVVGDENFEAVFAKARSREEREAMHGSKYMQARTGLIYRETEEALRSGVTVLFSGCPCQVGALYQYLSVKKADASNLYTMDLICHGVPSVLIWRGFMKMYGERLGRITQAVWRDKLQTGWGSSSSSSFYGQGKRDKETSRYFTRMFFTNLCLRDSCYQCEYASFIRAADLTMGDAWGVLQKNPEFNDSMGVSVVFVNTKKGEELLRRFSGQVDSMEVPPESYVQINMKEPSRPHRSVAEFWDDYEKKPFAYMIKKYGENNLLLNYRYALRRGVNALWGRKRES